MFSFDQAELVARLKKYPLLSKFSEEELTELVSQSEPFESPGDVFLFHSDDPSTHVYYVVEGCVEIFTSETMEKRFTIARSGDMIGETGAIAGESYGLTAKIHRPSRFLKINKSVFFRFFRRKPALLMLLAKTMAKRLRTMVMDTQNTHYLLKNVVLYIMTPEVSISEIKPVFEACAKQDKIRVYDKKNYEATGMELVPFLYQCEDSPGVNIFLVEYNQNTHDAWNQLFFHCEGLYFLIDESQMNNINAEVLEQIKRRPCSVVIWHPQPGPYANTRAVYDQYPFQRHHHIMSNKPDFQRLYRFMTGQAIGLVISGGGFRGYAHYGLIKALMESGIPIDYIGGSSMGAAVGALLAQNTNWQYFNAVYENTMTRLKSRKLFRLTLPLFSVLSGELMTNILKETFGAYQIEDLPINFFCIVSNLSKRQKEIKFQGELWEWLRASTAIPGVFPPLEKAGCVYVDGAVCTNLPVQDMRDCLDGAGTIITLDIRLPLLPKDKYSCPPSLPFWQAVAYKIGFSGKKYIFPTLLDIVLESSFINQYIYDSQGAKKADIIVAPDTSSLSFLNPSKGNPLSLIAYEYAKEKLKEYKTLYARWL